MFPDKFTYKTTITNKLRSEIVALAKEFDHTPSYLEIGCDVGYTMFSVCYAFSKCIGIDIDPDRIRKSEQVREHVVCVSDHVKMITGTSKDIPHGTYDIVLIDAGHDFDNVAEDVKNVMNANKLNSFHIVFHDYGLVKADVKAYVQFNWKPEEYTLIGEAQNWNQLGGHTDDYEAALVKISK